MKITLDLDGSIAQAIEDKINEKLPQVIEDVLSENIDEILRDIVIKQLRGCALIYLQSPDFRNKLMLKVKPQINELLGVQ